MSGTREAGGEKGTTLAFDGFAVPFRHPTSVAVGKAGAQLFPEFGELELAEFLARPEGFERFTDKLSFVGKASGFHRILDKFLQFSGKI